MPNAHNQAMMEQINADLENMQAIWIVDYRGLNVQQVEELRRGIRGAGAVMKVYKNTLMRIALAKTDAESIDEALAGPSAFIFSNDDPAASAKVLRDFAKDNETLTIKGGLMEGRFVDQAGIEAIASLPTREELLGQLAAAIAGIARGLAVTINGVPSGLAQSIKQVADQKPAA